jgi:hypothetical protein
MVSSPCFEADTTIAEIANRHGAAAGKTQKRAAVSGGF